MFAINSGSSFINSFSFTIPRKISHFSQPSNSDLLSVSNPISIPFEFLDSSLHSLHNGTEFLHFRVYGGLVEHICHQDGSVAQIPVNLMLSMRSLHRCVSESSFRSSIGLVTNKL